MEPAAGRGARPPMPEHILQVGNAALESWGPSETLHTVGQAIPKRSGFDKVTGRARYAFDVQLPGMLYAAIVRSTEARGRVVAIDTDRAAQIPGVRTILTPQNFPLSPARVGQRWRIRCALWVRRSRRSLPRPNRRRTRRRGLSSCSTKNILP